MKKTAIKYGMYAFITGIVLFLLSLTLGQDLDFDTQEVIGYSSIVVSLLFVYFGIKHFRDQVNNGVVSFKQALILGLLISIFAGIGIVIVDIIYTTLINPDFFDEYTQMLRDQGRADEIMDISSGFMGFIMFMTVVVVGVIITLLSALILQRKN